MKERKRSKGIAPLVLGVALFSSGLTGFTSGSLMSSIQTKQQEYTPTIERMEEIKKMLNVPVNKSDLYQKPSYEDEKTKISLLEEEHASLEGTMEKYLPYNRTLQGLLIYGVIGMLSGILIGGSGFKKYLLSRKEKTVRI